MYKLGFYRTKKVACVFPEVERRGIFVTAGGGSEGTTEQGGNGRGGKGEPNQGTQATAEQKEQLLP